MSSARKPKKEHRFSCPDGELDEIFIRNAFVHIERMDDKCFWIGIEGKGLPVLHLRTGVSDEGTWFFNIEEDKFPGGRFLPVSRVIAPKKKRAKKR